MGSMNVSHRAHHFVSTRPEVEKGKKLHANGHEASAQKTHAKPKAVSLTSSLQAFLGTSGLVAQPVGFPIPKQPTVPQAEFALAKAEFEAKQNPGLTSDFKVLRAAQQDLAAYERSDPNSPRVSQLKAQVTQLTGQVRHEAINQVDQAMNTYFQSGGTRADMQTLYNSVQEAGRALQHTAPGSAAQEYTSALTQYLQQQLMPRPPVMFF